MRKVIAPAAVVLLALILVAIVLVASDRAAFSCAGSSDPETTEATEPSTVSTTVARTTTEPPSTTTELPTTTSVPATTTTERATTTTTLSVLGTYRAEMWAWKNEHAEDLEAGYTVMISLTDPNDPTPDEVKAAKDLDSAMTEMVADLAAIQPPPVLAAAHAGYLASLSKMAEGVHDLALALEQGKALRAYAAMAAIGLAWQQGAPHRATLEAALGFSVSGA